MDPTRAFLLNEMANAGDLQTFFLAYRALQNLNRLAMQTQGVGPMTQGPQPVPGVYGPNQGQSAPLGQTPTNFRPRDLNSSEPPWGEGEERMPWEGQ